MPVYDLAHRLAGKIKESDEYTSYSQLREKILKDEKAKGMLLDFQKEQMILQTQKWSGKEITEEEQKKLKNLREIIELNPKIKNYIEAEYRMSILLNDLQEILFADLDIGILPEKENEEKHPD